jgi:hypothetical protein
MMLRTSNVCPETHPVTRRIYSFGITNFFLASLQSCYEYVTFLNYFSLRRLLSNKKKTVVDHAIDRFNHTTDRRFGCSPCLIATIRVSSKFGALGERFYNKRIWLQILKTLKEENNAFRELLWCEERGINATCFRFRI